MRLSDDPNAPWHVYLEQISMLRHFVEVAAKALSDASSSRERPATPSLLWSMAVVRLCSIVDAFVDEVVASQLRDVRVFARSDALNKLKAPVADLLLASEQERTELLLQLIKLESSARLRTGINRYEELLRFVELEGAVDETVRKWILELLEIRNVVVHRGALADDRLMRMCPWLRISRGSPLLITGADFEAYSQAADWYIGEVGRREAEAWAPDRIENPYEDLLETLRDVFATRERGG